MKQYYQKQSRPQYDRMTNYINNLNAQQSKDQKNTLSDSYANYIQNLNAKPIAQISNQIGSFESKNIKIQGAEKKDNIYVPYNNEKYTITRDKEQQAEDNQQAASILRQFFRVNKPILEIQRFDDIFNM